MIISTHFLWTIFSTCAFYQESFDCWLSFVFLLTYFGNLIKWRHAGTFHSAACSSFLLKVSFLCRRCRSLYLVLSPLVKCIFLILEWGCPLKLLRRSVCQSLTFVRSRLCFSIFVLDFSYFCCDQSYWNQPQFAWKLHCLIGKTCLWIHFLSQFRLVFDLNFEILLSFKHVLLFLF